MLSLAQKSMLLAFGHIIANIDCYVETASCFHKGSEHTRIRVSDEDASFIDLFGMGETLDEAFENVVRAFEAHPMGTSREAVQRWIDTGCPDDVEPEAARVIETAPETVKEPMVFDMSPEEGASEVDIEPVMGSPKTRGYSWDDPRYMGERLRRNIKREDARYERREAKRALRGAVDD